MAHLRRTAFVLLLLITLVTSCDKIPSPTAPTSTTTPVVESPVTPADFVGQVAIPINTDRHHNLPVPGVTVTIVPAHELASGWRPTQPVDTPSSP